MVQYVITPWRDRRELLRVREQLYSRPGDPAYDSSRRQAVSQVSVWVERGNCPHLVESTAILTSAILNDVPGNSTWCIRAAYASSFSRFVTGLLDSHQDKRRKLSMYSVAKTLGLPATYVELRHQATHEELPSLQKLRTASRKALLWIWDYYWVHLSIDDEAASPEDLRVYLRKLLEETNEKVRGEMEARLVHWTQDQLLDALMELELEAQDSEAFLRLVKLSKKLMNGNGESAREDELAPEMKVNSIEELRKELTGVQERLDDPVVDVPQRVELSPNDDSAVSGWSMYEGAWVSKPIGTVC
ncbi:hypothetical protein M430DRAFT_52287 [Amorphotheca resinae ATCC 22711]|uniref:Pre-rRNA-processing protein las1 n=1 Tax=Amorphotheca resinae ATCC 22711 TaxID=857342 RepID=A0A2T3AWQ5_AMORE|nr:hypothetical protein M430DRAFT_52287 [Amorphotheca resinae ATCC 22711]PSS13106.1 hypothetical protein M430DRAFT_52287 [Amorphotheca resinae ATCC 22711]